MENKGLIFIPDISGFTKFVNETEIEHSRVIIQELLEILINANEIGLEISEIEGDAILFYKFGEAPELEKIYKQVEKMFCDFHRYLYGYEHRRICQCSACKSAEALTLKVISHYGEFTGYNVKNFSKLIGKDIILAHQLLKNDIEQHEYWLVTEGLSKDKKVSGLPEWINWSNSAKQTESGPIPFQYVQLTPLKDMLPQQDPLEFGIKDKVKMLSFTRECDVEMNTIFTTALNFDFRGQWNVGIKKSDQVSTTLPQVGTSHRCVLEKGKDIIVYTSGFSYAPDKIVYSETDEKKMWSNTITFERLSENRTRVTADLYVKDNFMVKTVFKLTMKKKMEVGVKQSLINLEALAKKQEVVDTVA